ncbi:MAG: hypothetical protein R3D55_21710 [Chloroflexota bacterium]
MARIMTALHNPHVDMIAHPTGRLLPDRPGADLDMELVLQKRPFLPKPSSEINANPARLDCAMAAMRRAVEL